MSQVPMPPSESPYGPYPPAPPPSSDGKAIASLVLGILGLILWFCPLIGLGVTVPGLVRGIMSRNQRPSGMATAGIVLCVIGLVLSLINAAIGAYLGATGQHPLLNQ